MHPRTPPAPTLPAKLDDAEITITKRQATDRLGRPTETVTQTMRAATADAQAWIRRNR